MWTRAKLYPGALTIMIPRLIAFASTLVGLWIICQVITIGTSVNAEEPLIGWRQKYKLKAITWYCWFAILCVGLKVRVTDVDSKEISYKEYLGENYERDFKITKSGRCSTYVLNHSGPMDIFTLQTALKGDISFVGAEFVRNMPIMGFLSTVIQTIFVPRGVDQSARDRVVKQISERQRKIETYTSWSPLAVFAEGTTSNNKCLTGFKKGAFVGKRAVIPAVYKYNIDGLSVHPFVDTTNDWQMHAMTCSQFSFCIIDLKFFPPFQPNDYLFEHHYAKGKESWEIYAWAVRDFMVKNSHLESHDQPIREKLDFQNYLNNKSDSYLPKAEEPSTSEATNEINESDTDKKKKKKKKSKGEKEETTNVSDKKD